MPARTYSSGMMLRLAFAVSTRINPEILLLDEWIITRVSQLPIHGAERLAGACRHRGGPPDTNLLVYIGDRRYDIKSVLVVILAWRYAELIMAKHRKYLAQGGRFVVPLPRIEVFS